MRKSYVVDGRHEFTLEFLSAGTHYEIYARSWPKNPHSDDQRKTHVSLKTGRICVTPGKQPRTMEKAVAIGQAWCSGYAEYIRTGNFPNGKRRVDV